ncbi:hypothetical protein [Tepidiforma sp.]|uniref:hypothetical protein n=1 Tax=Tepidiforma sp. TaxID=2682230 RepID=UPI0021DC51D7|nr:hypothetical protein [Tepidiforma sp.]MCX7618727.1 hypothetical protein [Tepidiforma sp.]GIW17852.1 MAG: hypothetical protein KatS3mg064_1009 [Tepidiforma sp.]
MSDSEPYLTWVAPERVTPETWLPGGDLPPLAPGTRVLLDCTAVREVTVPAENIAAAAQQLHRMGVRLALLAGSPLVFGLGRQAIQLSGLPEGVAFAVFMARDEALRWLLGARGMH